MKFQKLILQTPLFMYVGGIGKVPMVRVEIVISIWYSSLLSYIGIGWPFSCIYITNNELHESDVEIVISVWYIILGYAGILIAYLLIPREPMHLYLLFDLIDAHNIFNLLGQSDIN